MQALWAQADAKPKPPGGLHRLRVRLPAQRLTRPPRIFTTFCIIVGPREMRDCQVAMVRSNSNARSMIPQDVGVHACPLVYRLEGL
jgi:hypothetical protein